MTPFELVVEEKNIPEAKIPNLQTAIGQLEAEMRKHPNQIEIKVTHHFSKGVYAREIFIPKGATVVGKIHKHQNLNIMSKGSGIILSQDGKMEIHAPYTVVSGPGVKRAFYALEDTIWTTIHGTEETDVEKIEALFIAKTYDEVVMINEKENLSLKGAK